MPRALIVQNDEVSGPGTLEQAIYDAGWEVEFWLPFREGQDLALGEHQAMLAFGGRVDPQSEDARPWLDRERKLIELALESETPFLGVCLGGQLLAQVIGGEAPSDPPTELGWQEIDATPAARDDELLGDLRGPVFEFHYNGIQAPEAATVLATTGGVDQAFRAGERAWGVQFHPEIDLGIVGLLTVLQPERLREADVHPLELRRRTAELAHGYTEWAHELVGRLLGLAKES